MTSYEFGDIVLVPFPFTDQTTQKKRPAVVISSAAYHQAHPDLIVMAITSQMQAATIADNVTVTNWQGAGLLTQAFGYKAYHCNDSKGTGLEKTGKTTGRRLPSPSECVADNFGRVNWV